MCYNNPCKEHHGQKHLKFFFSYSRHTRGWLSLLPDSKTRLVYTYSITYGCSPFLAHTHTHLPPTHLYLLSQLKTPPPLPPSLLPCTPPLSHLSSSSPPLIFLKFTRAILRQFSTIRVYTCTCFKSHARVIYK